MRFLSLAVSSVCAASLRLSSDWCLASSFISSRWWSLCMVWILPCSCSMVSSCVEISWRKPFISPFRDFDLPVAQPTAASRSSLPFSLFSLERFSLIALSRSSLCRSFSFAFSIRELVLFFASCIFWLVISNWYSRYCLVASRRFISSFCFSMMKSLRSRCTLSVSALDCPRFIKRMSEAKVCISIMSLSLSFWLFPVSWFIQSNTMCAW